MNKKFEDYKTLTTYSVELSGYYDNLDVELLDGNVNLKDNYAKLVIGTSTPIRTTINGDELSINFKAIVGYDLKPFMRNQNYQLNLELAKLTDYRILAIKLVNGEINELNEDAIKEFLINELKKTLNIEIKYLLKEGPFDKFD